MIDTSKRASQHEEKEKVRRRMRKEIDPENYEYIPESKRTDYYDNNTQQLVGIYVRVSTDDIRQTTSFELQKKYYEEFVEKHPNWTLVKIYADEGISGTSTKKRDAFNQMIADAKAGKITLIITKSVSRFARNVLDFIGIVRNLAERKPAVGVFFESEAIFSLNDDSQMALSFQATMPEEESHTRSRSMETSLRMRLDNGIPLTPKLLGYTHDMDGNLVVNPEEAPTVKLAFYMYLYGYSTQQIADALIALDRKSYLGNVCWTSSSIIQILRNERHCGDVLTRKTFTPNFRDHKSRRNRGEKPQSRYMNHHEAIISRDDFIAVQQMLDNSKYRNKAYLPELRVIESGMLKGFVIINPRWAAFKELDYYQAAQSVYSEDELKEPSQPPVPVTVTVEAGDFDLRGFELARSELFDTYQKPNITFSQGHIKLSKMCINKFGARNSVELLVNPLTRKFAIRAVDASNRQAVVCSKLEGGKYVPKDISTAAFSDTLFKLFGWKSENKYRITGSLYEDGEDIVYVFEVEDSEAFFKPYIVPLEADDGSGVMQPYLPSGKRIRGIPEAWTERFGKEYYWQEHTLAELAAQSESEWKLRLEGQLYETGKKLNVTSFEDLRTYIKQELNGVQPMEGVINE